MLNYDNLYKDKLRTPEDAVKAVQSGDWVDYGWATGTPVVLDKALAGRYQELKDVKIRGAVLFEVPAVMQVPEVKRHFVWNSWHCSGVERKLCAEGLGYYIPMRYSELPRFYRENIHVNVAMFRTAPMDHNGMFNFGMNASHMKAVCDAADIVIVEVDNTMPYCLGEMETGVHISDVTYIVESNDEPVWDLPAAGSASPADQSIASLIVPEIPDGACLQFGIGRLPNTIGKMIAKSDLKHLGVHTEMYVDAFFDIAKAGKIDGSYKGVDRNRQTFAFAAGSRDM